VVPAPRAPLRLPAFEIDIPPPPPAPSEPGGSLWLQLLPVLLAAVGMGVILLVGSGQGGAMMIVLLAGTLLLVGGGALVSVLTQRGQSAAFKRQTRERIERYYDMLRRTRDRVQGLLDEQRMLLLGKDPDPSRCARF